MMLLGSAYGKVGLDTSGVVTGVQNAVNTLKNFKSTMELAGGGLDRLKNSLDTAKTAVNAARAELDRMKLSGAEALKPATENLRKLQENAKAANQAVRDAREELNKVRAAGGDVKPASDALKVAQENAKAANKAVRGAREELEKLKGSGAAGVKAAADQLEKLETNARSAATAVRSAEMQMEQLRTAGMQLGQGMQNVGNALTVGVTLPLIAAGGAAIKFASDLNESRSLTGVIFEDMSKDILKWSEDANSKLQMTRKEALDAANDFAIFGKAAQLSGNDLVKFSEANTQLAADLASTRNTSSAEAITAIGAAYRGEMEPIRKYGVLLNQQAIDAKAAEMGLLSMVVDQDKVTVATLAVEKAQKSYNDALTGTPRKSGDAAIAAKELQLVQSRLADARTVDDTKVAAATLAVEKAQYRYNQVLKDAPKDSEKARLALGDLKLAQDRLADSQTVDHNKVAASTLAAEKAQNRYNQSLAGNSVDSENVKIAQQELELAQNKLAEATAGSTGELSQQARIMAANKLIMEQTAYAQGDIARTGGEVAGQMKEANKSIQDLLADFGTYLLPLAKNALVMLNSLLKFLSDLSPETQQAAIGFLAIAVALGPVLSTLGGLLMFAMQMIAVWPFLVTGVGLIAPAFIGISAVITGTLIPAFTAVLATITSTVIPALVGILVIAGPIIVAIALIGAAVFLLYAVFSTNFMGITEFYTKWWNDLVTGAQTGWRNLQERIQIGIRNVQAMFQLDWGVIGRNMMAGITNGITSGIAAVVDAARRSALAAWEAFKKALEMRSPSRKFEWAGKMSMLGYMQGMSRNLDPNEIARVAAKPVQAIGRSAQQNNTYQFRSGLTLRDAQRMQAESTRRVERLEKVLGLGGA